MTTAYTMNEAPGALPLAGHLLAWLKDPHRFMRELPAHGDLVAIRLGYVRAVVVCHPELVHQMLLNDREFDKGGVFFERGREGAGNGLITCPYSDHRRQRRLMQPAFHRARLPSQATMMTQQIAQVTDSWRDRQVIDVVPAIRELICRITLATLFARSAEDSEYHELSDTMRQVTDGLYRRLVTPPGLDRLPTPSKRRYDRANARMRRIAHRYIADYRRNGIDHDDLTSLLLRAAPGERPLQDTEIAEQIITVLGGSVETTSSLLASVLHVLASSPDVEERLHRECDTVLAGRTATWDDLPRLRYTGQVLNETLRLYSPAWVLSRSNATDAVLGGHSIPAGTTLFYSPYQMHVRAERYPDPDRFDPDRWPADGGFQPPTDEFVPFGAGARKCIGETFAWTEGVLFVASIAGRWRLRPVDGRPVSWTKGVTLAPRNLRMTLHARTPCDLAVQP